MNWQNSKSWGKNIYFKLFSILQWWCPHIQRHKCHSLCAFHIASPNWVLFCCPPPPPPPLRDLRWPTGRSLHVDNNTPYTVAKIPHDVVNNSNDLNVAMVMLTTKDTNDTEIKWSVFSSASSHILQIPLEYFISITRNSVFNCPWKIFQLKSLHFLGINIFMKLCENHSFQLISTS